MIADLLARHSASALVLLVAAAFIASLARGFSGFGGALIFVPLASAAVGPQAAAPILLVIDGIAQLALLKNAWRQANRREVAIMAAGALIGIPLGVAILAHVDATTLRWAIAVLIVAMLALLISGWRYHGRPSTSTTVGVGFSAGILSGAVQAAGPPVVAYWLGGSNSALTVRANIILFFFCTSVVASVSYLVTGLLGPDVLLLSALTVPGYALGMFLGTRMFGLASDAMFRRVCFILIAAAAIVSLPVLDPVLR
jgi:uncharacterized membrane protein YfcA